MGKNLLVLALVSLPLLNGGCVVGEESGTGVDSDYPFDYEVAITAQLPAEAPADAAVWVAEKEAGFAAEAECDDAGFCTFLAFEPGTYVLTVTSDTAIFLAESVTLDEAGTEPELVTWDTDGCGDETWTPESHTACATWTPGEWGLAPNGSYRWVEQERTVGIVTDNSPDVTGDGAADITISFDDAEVWPTMTVAGDHFYGIDGVLIFSGVISDDLGIVERLAYNGVNPEDDTFERQ